MNFKTELNKATLYECKDDKAVCPPSWLLWRTLIRPHARRGTDAQDFSFQASSLLSLSLPLTCCGCRLSFLLVSVPYCSLPRGRRNIRARSQVLCLTARREAHALFCARVCASVLLTLSLEMLHCAAKLSFLCILKVPL